jgi:predicted hydrocarbon binding protein
LKHDAARGELSEGAARYLLIRHDSLMGLFQRLAEPARSEALAAFAASVAEHGGRSAESYRADNPSRLLPKLAEKASELGWGNWSFALEGESIVLTVHNSPFAQGFGNSSHPVCAPIAGMLQAVASMLSGEAAAASETSCAAMGGGDACVFRASRR